MELVIDANILFSVFKPDSFTRDFFKVLYFRGAKLIIPGYGLDEVFSLKDKICRFCGIDESEFMTSFVLLCEILTVVPKSEFDYCIPRAKELLSEHPKDVPYFALALSLNCAIWSNEKRFKQQSIVSVFSTQELKELFGLS